MENMMDIKINKLEKALALAPALALTLALAAERFKIFPIKQGTKNKPLVRWVRGGPGKQATDDPEIIKGWWTKWPKANIGIATGPSKLLVLDIDMKNGKNGEEALQCLDIFYNTPPPTREVRTPTGGRHLIYRVDIPVPSPINFMSDLLGNGIDIRSAGAMIVASGSKTEAGAYTWINPETPFADAPEWLVDLCRKNAGASKERRLKERKTGAAPQLAPLVPLDEDYAVERAIALLQQHPPALEGDGGDQHTFSTACSVKDYGISEGKCLELLLEYWNETCEPPWQIGDLKKKVRNAYAYGSEPPGVMSPVADFEPVAMDDESLVVKDEQPPVSAPATKRFMSLEEIKNLPPASWLIKGFIPENSFGILYGEPGTLKSFLALHITLCLANGTDFFGRRVLQGGAFYLAGESPAGIRPRIAAWEQHFGYSDEQPPFYLQRGGAALNRDGEVAKFAHDILAISKTPKLIVVDTIQVYLAGNENGPDDMGSFVQGCLELRNRTGAAVLVVHHLGKDHSRGVRGHTSLIGAADFMYETKKNEHTVEVICKKMKEADDNFRMILEPVTVLVDPESEFPDSLVLKESDQPVNTETMKILELATEFDGKGQNLLVQAVKEFSITGAYQKVKNAIPEGKENAISFDGGSLWIEPHPTNPKHGAKTVRFEQDFEELEVEGDEPDFLE